MQSGRIGLMLILILVVKRANPRFQVIRFVLMDLALVIRLPPPLEPSPTPALTAPRSRSTTARTIL